MKKIAILGSTGSVGLNALRVISAFKDEFEVVGLTANSNLKRLSEQIKRFRPKIVCLAAGGKKALPGRINGVKAVSGPEGLMEVATHPDVDMVVFAIAGSASLVPLLGAIEAGKQIALASKEALVSGGEIVIKAAKRNNVRIIPVDSEHSAIFQCLNGRERNELRKIYLTGTGGPLRKLPRRLFDALTPEEVVNHPKWNMGRKISVDSATLMNKGLEVIEARWLFGVSLDEIEVLIHPEALVHSMVEFIDGAILAQLSVPDMRLPIQYALGYPLRLKQKFNLRMNFRDADKITFSRPDTNKFPCLGLAYSAARQGGTSCAVLNASNEEAVLNYLERKIKFSDIPRIVEKALSRHRRREALCLDAVLQADRWAREEVRKICFRA